MLILSKIISIHVNRSFVYQHISCFLPRWSHAATLQITFPLYLIVQFVSIKLEMSTLESRGFFHHVSPKSCFFWLGFCTFVNSFTLVVLLLCENVGHMSYCSTFTVCIRWSMAVLLQSHVCTTKAIPATRNSIQIHHKNR